MLSPVLLSAGSDELLTFDFVQVLTDGVATVKGDVMTAMAITVPSIIAVTGAVVAVRFGIRWLKKLGKG